MRQERVTLFECEDCGQRLPSDQVEGNEAGDAWVCQDYWACRDRQAGPTIAQIRDLLRSYGDRDGFRWQGERLNLLINSTGREDWQSLDPADVEAYWSDLEPDHNDGAIADIWQAKVHAAVMGQYNLWARPGLDSLERALQHEARTLDVDDDGLGMAERLSDIVDEWVPGCDCVAGYGFIDSVWRLPTDGTLHIAYDGIGRGQGRVTVWTQGEES